MQCLCGICVRMATCTELYIDTLGGLDLDGSTDKNLLYFVVENLATLAVHAMRPKNQQSGSLTNSR